MTFIETPDVAAVQSPVDVENSYGDRRTDRQKLVDEELKSRVQRGIALLDEHVPGWEDKVDVMRLVLSSANSCVLGQVFDDYSAGVERLELSEEDASDHGFLLGSSDGYTYRELTAVWQETLA